MATGLYVDESRSTKGWSEKLRDKVLIVFSDKVANREEILFEVFGVEDNAGKQIHRDVVWTTKYYNVTLDVYVDSFSSLKDWTREFCDPDLDELREVIAGWIIVLPFNGNIDEETKALTQLKSCATSKDFFTAILATELNVSENTRAFLEYELLEGAIELVQDEVGSDSELGEVSGLDRVKEIIDTCEWHPRLLRTTHPKSEINVGSAGADTPLIQIMGRLREARTKYMAMDPGLSREEFASEMARELSRFL
ncbi:LAQU0S14e02652g1_1 [Lachancea quebecensis]|uniref:Increased recombination centers protein 6 n=1 Tax=Lachancea quebecensis TaxID=1654605 RepID=A0A0N7MM62_9SACH|nr:LAQU0S14e02652g1_1 [Lachancea quebecensis]